MRCKKKVLTRPPQIKKTIYGGRNCPTPRFQKVCIPKNRKCKPKKVKVCIPKNCHKKHCGKIIVKKRCVDDGVLVAVRQDACGRKEKVIQENGCGGGTLQECAYREKKVCRRKPKRKGCYRGRRRRYYDSESESEVEISPGEEVSDSDIDEVIDEDSDRKWYPVRRKTNIINRRNRRRNRNGNGNGQVVDTDDEEENNNNNRRRRRRKGPCYKKKPCDWKCDRKCRNSADEMEVFGNGPSSSDDDTDDVLDSDCGSTTSDSCSSDSDSYKGISH